MPEPTRRGLLVGGAGALVAGALAPSAAAALDRRRLVHRAVTDLLAPRADQWAALRALGRTSMRLPDSLPNAALPAGTDTLPEIEHVVVLMLENHSYDNLFGMLGRGPFAAPRGDGFTIAAADGYPADSNPQADGTPLRAFRMPTTCQPHGKPSQEWEASHVQYAGGRNDGFVVSSSGPVAMGYWSGRDLPFTYDLATRFPIGDRWFSSLLGQTDPQRRYLIAATSSGMTDDIGTSAGNGVPDSQLAVPAANGTIFQRLSDAHVSWIDYNASFPTGATMELYPSNDGGYSTTNAKPIAQFYTDAAAGALPSVSLLDPDYGTQSQEDPQNIVRGESLLRGVVEALGASPKWERTLLIFTYDEHGGYYDHVPPPAALAPDAIAPVVQPGEQAYEGFRRYGFRVPAVLVGPYAKPGHVSHVVHDHTSILAFIERKWNLAAMTYRDANANDLTDFLDMTALAARRPTFPELPPLAASGENARTLACSSTGPGTIPPPRPAPLPIQVELDYGGASRRRRGLVLSLRASRAELTGLTVELRRGARVLASHRIGHLSTVPRRLVLRRRGRIPPTGHYTLVVVRGGRTLARRRIAVR